MRYSVSLVVRKMWVKITIKYHYTSIRLTNMGMVWVVYAAGRTVNWGNHTPGQLSNRNANLTHMALHSDIPFLGICPEQIIRQLLKIYIQITWNTLNTHGYAVGYIEDDRLIQLISKSFLRVLQGVIYQMHTLFVPLPRACHFSSLFF